MRTGSVLFEAEMLKFDLVRLNLNLASGKLYWALFSRMNAGVGPP